ncbi:hypothetical protein KC980_03575 [candidate division WWE3 bacterium]|uniref:ASCH domain-containing protein n=1 Tax=candidate division WWE3 bacterium TaxID=2053526 RepID=A0A955J243_UNCKA|nr:hypothetical protein [candidate division WWE3 bacterium]
MDHVAILRKSKISKDDNLLQDILDGKKTIESRWYVNKIAPWNKICTGDTIYFKESGCSVTAKAVVSKVLQFEDLNEAIIQEISILYAKGIAPKLSILDFEKWALSASKRYCILAFLKDVVPVSAFDIDKMGFGISSAWLVVGDIKNVMK